MLCPPLLLGKNSAYPNNGGNRFIRNTSTYHPNYLLSRYRNPKSVLSGLTKVQGDNVRGRQNATCQIICLFVSCLLGDPVIMHTIQHWQQTNVNKGNDRMITNKVKSMFSSGTNLPQYPTSPQEICDVQGASGAGFPPSKCVFLSV
jgi:hypothetical protein